MYSIHLVSGQQYGGFHMGGHDPKRMFGSSQRDQRDKNIKINMENLDLWRKFHSLGTEMIITKTGRWAGEYKILNYVISFFQNIIIHLYIYCSLS